MVELRWIQIALHLTLVLQFTATDQHRLSFIVRDGGDVTLPCENMKDNLYKCDNTTWMYSNIKTVKLVKSGQIDKTKITADKLNRLSVTENCSLVIKKVTVKDVGEYSCREHNKTGLQQGQNSVVFLSVINLTKHEKLGNVTLNCSVRTYGDCRHKVKWLLRDEEVDKEHIETETQQSTCSSSMTFETSHVMHMSMKDNLLKCNVTDSYTRAVQQFTFSSQSSSEKTDWRCRVIVAVGSAALLITAVAFIGWNINKRNSLQTDENMPNPDDGVSYASIRYTKNTTGEIWVQDGDDSVTYSTVKAPSSSTGLFTDPNNIYSTIN
ncbi:uncharacterized protein LOC113149040 [Anabas testudineus]|uniref:uncharacterized protein LOC113149040 n=1 Tax=Anabas testudineus TaxID=64144 RepID=UPI000E45B1AA|nr:uncharacterized protein LOC113149040 [Anabas testudineus]